MTRTLIVNADDLGRSPAINAGIVAAHVEGVVTSASLMVRWDAAAEAVELARRHPGLALGLHLDLGEWRLEDWDWTPTYAVVDVEDEAAVRDEARAQVARFRELVGRDPTHLDSHQHVHVQPPVSQVADRWGAELGVPVRHRSREVRHVGDFYGRTREGEPYHEGITVESLLRLVRRLPEGVTELSCHPGDASVDDPLYGPERAIEVATLCDPRVRAAIDEAGIRLASFATYGSSPPNV